MTRQADLIILISRRLDKLEKKYDVQFEVVFDAIRQLMAPPGPKPKKTGFHVRERKALYKTSGRKRVWTNDGAILTGRMQK